MLARVRDMILCFLAAAPALADPPLKVCATTPDLGSLVREIGGDRVELSVFAKGTEDPHFIEAKPSFIKQASEADALVQTGLELEVGWLPAILQNARNDRILPSAPGLIDASAAITPLEVPTGVIDRSMGDVHAAGNPHYLTDPVNGVKVAALIADRLGTLRPGDRRFFEDRLKDFRARVDRALVGETLAAKYDAQKLALLAERGGLNRFLESQGDAAALAGWLGELRDAPGVKVVADHNLWPYFAKRFGLVVIGYLEPKPGVPPTTRHLEELIGAMKQAGARLILSTVYFDPRHAAFVADKTGARTVDLANQPGSRPGTDDYIAMCDHNVRQVARALKEGK
jgi:zinc/manganese transport system substrate-binding protein